MATVTFSDALTTTTAALAATAGSAAAVAVTCQVPSAFGAV